MRVSAVVIAFASVLSLGAAQSAIVKDDRINMSCDFAQDKTGMLQYPYCCRDLTPLRGNPHSNGAEDCMFISENGEEHCANVGQAICCTPPSCVRTSLGQLAAILLLVDLSLFVAKKGGKKKTNHVSLFLGPEEDLYLARRFPARFECLRYSNGDHVDSGIRSIAGKDTTREIFRCTYYK